MKKLIFQLVVLGVFGSGATAATNVVLTDGGSTIDSSGTQISCVGSKQSICYCDFYNINVGYMLKISRLNESGTASLSPYMNKADCLAELAARPECK